MTTTLFQIDDQTSILCEVYSNSRNWGHRARLFKNGQEVKKVTITYYNRTWESFQFESVIKKLVDKLDDLSYEDIKDKLI